jgi:hypothetical protein
MLTESAIPLLMVTLALLACGGSDEDTSNATPAMSDGLPTRPLDGQIRGRSFVARSAALRPDKVDGGWQLTLMNYDSNCGISSAPPGTDKMIAVIGHVEPKAGRFDIQRGDGHVATFQVGLYLAGGPEPESELMNYGILRLDTWSDAPGTQVTGALRLAGATSEVAGTFAARVCAAQ